jgi:Xaa-Pro aminopeptidase
MDRHALVGARLEHLREILDRRAAAALVLRQRRDFAWLTVGGQNHVLLATERGVAPVVVTRGDAVVLAPVNEYARIADEELAGLPLRVASLPWWDTAAEDQAIVELAEGGRVLAATDVAEELTALRSLLAPLEHERMRELAQQVLAVTRAALAAVAGGGTTEDAVGAAIAGRLAAAGTRLPVLLAAADERIDLYRHPLPSAAPIRRRLMVVVVAERWGLHVAHTEFVELEPPSADLVRRAQAVGAVLRAMREATKPGHTLGDVLAVARDEYARHGLDDEWTLHHQGGTIGYQARERIATPGDETRIQPGMAFAWNPSARGYKVEETLLLDESGASHVLTTTPA